MELTCRWATATETTILNLRSQTTESEAKEQREGEREGSPDHSF
jgi:hypothetical protein